MWWVVATALAGPFGSAIDGWEMQTPGSWRVFAEDAGTVALVNDTEPGLLLVTYTHGASWDDLRQEAAATLTDQGTALAVMGAPTERVLGVTKAVTAEYRGTGPSGAPLAARGIGLAGPSGGLVVLGFTTPLELPVLARRVEELASSVKFVPPNPGNVAALDGTWCNVDAPQARMVFDGKGALIGPAGEKAATYGVDGDVVVVRFPDGAGRRCRRDVRGAELVCAEARWTTAACHQP